MHALKILRHIPELAQVHGPVVLAIGVFDGVHLGHRAVIERALSDARSINGSAVIVTFDPHPIRVLRPKVAPRLLTSTPHKQRLIAQLGAEHLLIIPFDRSFADLPADHFIRLLDGACHPLREICVGHQWSFGKGRSGNLESLKILGDELGFEEVGVPAVEIDRQIVSSTLIRGAVERGDLARAERFLGRPYSVLGTVVEGDHLGKKLGFPTANLSTHNEQFPPDGVYVVDALYQGSALRGVVNIGVRPTIETADGSRTLEVHLLDFSKEIYGEDLELTFRQLLRAERKFVSLEALREQIARDIAAARQL